MKMRERSYALKQPNIDYMMNMTKKYLSGEMDVIDYGLDFTYELENDIRRCIMRMMITVILFMKINPLRNKLYKTFIFTSTQHIFLSS